MNSFYAFPTSNLVISNFLISLAFLLKLIYLNPECKFRFGALKLVLGLGGSTLTLSLLTVVLGLFYAIILFLPADLLSTPYKA